MKFDQRIKPAVNKPELTPADLPVDYLKLVEETLKASLEKGFAELKKIHPVCDLKANGAIYAEEVLLAITISHGEKSLIATTTYASCDFNPLAEAPGIEAVLSSCLDSVATVLEYYLDPKHPERIAQLADAPISALEEAPFEWTKMEEAKLPTWVKIDKTNPMLEAIAEDWLKKNDPDYAKHKAELEGEIFNESEEFLSERLEAIQKAKSGSSGSSGPITH